MESQHGVVRNAAGVFDRTELAHLTLGGPDAYEYLQGQVTNDVEALTPGTGCYAAMLNPKGRILADMRVLSISPEELWLDVEAVAFETALRELTMYKIGRRVEVAEAERAILSVIGPRAWEALAGAGLVTGTPPASESSWVRGSDEAVVVATDTGYDLLVDSAMRQACLDALRKAGVDPVGAQAVEVLRIERGRPRHGVDMSDQNLPGEAGIVDRAVSFTKGCYVGQEPVARMFHKGHPNRHLRILVLDAPVEAGTTVTAAGKDVGRVTSVGVSPVHGPIALGILRREVTAGDEVAAGTATAKVVDPPLEG